MIAGALWCAPDAGNTEFAAATGLIVIRAEHATPRMGAALLDRPAPLLGMSDRSFNLGLGVRLSGHRVVGYVKEFNETMPVVK